MATGPARHRNWLLKTLPDLATAQVQQPAEQAADNLSVSNAIGSLRAVDRHGHDLSPDQLSRVTPDQACAHPNWVMGRKISVDSATMMNKGLEVIEARWLFDLPAHQIDVVIHPQSVVHSMAEFKDGTLKVYLPKNEDAKAKAVEVKVT